MGVSEIAAAFLSIRGCVGLKNCRTQETSFAAVQLMPMATQGCIQSFRMEEPSMCAPSAEIRHLEGITLTHISHYSIISVELP